MFDLPQIYSRPSASALIDVLNLVAWTPPSWDYSPSAEVTSERSTAACGPNNARAARPARQVNPEGLVNYLTQIVASALGWIDDENTKEKIWNLASVRLGERSGRSAMPAMSRTFKVATPQGPVDVTLHEPALTADNLGLKTWAASYLLAKRLCTLKPFVEPLTVLELGSGTGLVGIAAACAWSTRVLLTDLPDVEPNLARNIAVNKDTIDRMGGIAVSEALNWADTSRPKIHEERPSVILAADPLYSPEHPKLLVDAIQRWLLRIKGAAVIVELPIRQSYISELRDFKERMQKIGLEVVEQGHEVGYDDWETIDGGLEEVACWWAVYRWTGEQHS